MPLSFEKHHRGNSTTFMGEFVFCFITRRFVFDKKIPCKQYLKPLEQFYIAQLFILLNNFVIAGATFVALVGFIFLRLSTEKPVDKFYTN